MWLNDEHTTDSALDAYRSSLLSACPNHIVIDGLFNQAKLDQLIPLLQQNQRWATQQHTYSALYVDNAQWQAASREDRFVQRDVWQRSLSDAPSEPTLTDNLTHHLAPKVSVNLAHEFLSFLRSDDFMSVLSRLFNVSITDINVADPAINTNYFRLGKDDFVEQHADDSPGREVCMLLYLNKGWSPKAGGELVFNGSGNNPVSIAPLYNRCVLFDPFSKGSEHWVNRLNAQYADAYRYNVTSWYWTE